MPSLFNSAKKTDVTVRSMIEEYLARGGAIHRLESTDARIKPYKRVLDWDSISPQADAGTVLRATRERRAPPPRAYENWPPSEAVITRVGECQSAPGSSRAQRFAILEVGATLGQLRERGLRLGDLTRYLGSGVVEIDVASGAAPSTPVAETEVSAAVEVTGDGEFDGI